MPQTLRVLAAVFGLFLAVGPLGTATALAETAGIVAQATTTGSIIGTATDQQGQPLGGVTITATGPAGTRSASTDPNGAYSLTNLPPGLYQVTASRPGYSSALQTDWAVLAGQQSALNVSLTAATLSSLREIGRVSVNARRGGFNSSPAAVTQIPVSVFSDQTQPQVQRVLDQTPGIVIDHPGTSATNAAPGAITFPSIRGGLGFETASLIDGHPLAVGSFGDYVTTFLNSYTLSGVELIKGPGAAAPQVNFAIGGTVNFRTREPTNKPFGQIVLGRDQFGGDFSNFLYSGTTKNGKLGWVLQYAIDGSPGPLKDSFGYNDIGNSVLINGVAQRGFTTSPVANAATNGIQNNPLYSTSSLISCCLPVNQNYNSKTELVKFKYNFSGATTATVSYLGSQTWTDQNGNHVYQFQQLFTPGAAYPAGGVNGLLAPGNTYPTWQNVFFPRNEWEVNNEPIFQAELRTTFGKDIVLGRFYTASINRLQYNAITNPNDTYTENDTLYGTFNNAAGAAVTYTGQSVPLTFVPTGPVCQNSAGYFTACAAGQAPYRYTSPFYFRGMEEDKLHGGSFEFDHFVGNTGSVISFAYDQVNSNTHSYDYDTSPSAPSIPAGSKQQFQTFLLRGIFNVGPKLNLTVSNYLNTYYQRFSTNKAVTAAQSAAYVAANPGAPAPIVGLVNPFMTFSDSRYTHYDARVGLSYRYSPNVALRAAAGSAIAPPYLNLLNVATVTPVLNNTGTFYCQAGNSACTSAGFNTGASVRPETSMGYDLGADIRLSSDGLTIFSGDVYRTNLFNQFVTATFVNGGWNGTTNCTVGSTAACLPLFSVYNSNLSNARYEGIEASVRRDPALGFGFVAQGALLRAYPYNISKCFYVAPSANGTQNCSGPPVTNLGIIPGINFVNSGTSGSPGSWNAVSNHAIPYAQGYGELHYRLPKDGYLSFGEQYYGNNNSLNVPAFWVGNASARFPLMGDGKTWFQISADNLFNIYGAAYITPFGGVGVPLLNGNTGLTNANVIGPRNIRLTITKNFGG